MALEVDGGVNTEHCRRESAEAGANLLVTGSAVFGAEDPAAAYAAIAAAAGAGLSRLGAASGRRSSAGSHSTAVAPK